MDLLPIRPGMKYCSNWEEIHRDDTQFNQGGIQCNLSEFTPIFTNISCLVKFDRARNTAQIGSKSIEMIPNLTRETYNEFTPIFTNISCPVKFQIRPVEFDWA